ncbi:MAM and LDL-receptor class A domain-containing protein 2-like [Mytilus californianus]|uniref:MAM and LDL-receptor class A domain-containing protein 2-like n=1 Tax=Mytilus californianus TaxID=6549 RepID=UPI0022476E88|nr:MAM and LDL-receptor class A domain-containing protein 2-like [Mytilus californianus]
MNVVLQICVKHKDVGKQVIITSQCNECCTTDMCITQRCGETDMCNTQRSGKTDLCNTQGCGETDNNAAGVNVCYRCSGNLQSETCHKIAFCKQDELCFTKEEFRNGEKYIFTGCMEKRMCNMDIDSIFGKRAEPDLQCCSDNLCNGHINQTLTTIKPSQTSSTPVIPASTTPFIPASTSAPVTLIPSECTNTASSVVSPINCDFEKVDICNYMEDNNNKIDWRRHTGMTSSLNTGPSADHTTSKGYYMYIETSLALRKGDSARIWSMPTSSTKGQCISFWYNMYGVSIGTLNVYIADNSTGTEQINLVWSLSGNQGNTWHIANVPLSDLQSMKVIFEGIAGDGYTGDIAIDDIQLMDACPCPDSIPTPGPSTIAPLSTEYQTDSTTPPSITITSQASEATSTLPTTTDSTTPPSITFTITPQASEATSTLPTTTDSTTPPSITFTITPQASEATSTLPTTTDSTTPPSITFTITSQASEATSTLPTTTVTLPPVSTSPTIVESPINCAFENTSICHYRQESGEEHDWLRHSGRTNSLNTGPIADHTYNTSRGHYVYLESSNSIKKGEIARLWTPLITPTNGQCLSFWYNMYGMTVGNLTIYTGNNSTGSEQLDSAICTISGNQGQSWKQKCILLPDSKPINIVFEAETGDGYTGDIALDDVNLNFVCPCQDTCS